MAEGNGANSGATHGPNGHGPNGRRDRPDHTLNPDGPLAGVRITDFSWFWAGPYASTLLGMLGAEVIRIESANRLDTMRRVRSSPRLDQIEQAHSFSEVNYNKRSVTLDLRRPEAKAIVRRLIAISDAVLENFSPGVLKRMGFGYEAIREIQPSIILCSVSAAGQDGPDQHHVGFATIFNAVSGMGSLTGYPDAPPTDIRDGSDLRTGNSAAAALLAALIHRRRTGEGQAIDLSAREALASMLGDHLLDYFINQRIRTREGNQDPAFFPHDCYPCAGSDRWVSIAVTNSAEWAALCVALDRPEWANDRHYATVEGRRSAAAEIEGAIAEFTRRREPAEAAARLQAAGVPAEPVMSNADIHQDAHLAEREALVETDHPVMGRRRVIGVPWKLSRTPAKIVRSAPLIGEDNAYVFGDLLGMRRADIDELTESGVIR